MDAIAGIDHVIVGVRDLEAARTVWQRLGFALSPRGRHLEQPTGNYCVMFADDYIELLGIVGDGGTAAHRLESFLAWREGPMGLAFAPVGGAAAAREALVRRGIHPGEPRPLSRQIEMPAGSVSPRFSLVSLPADETPGLDVFICGHLTPELMRRPEWLDHPNGAVGIAAVHILVDATAPLLDAYDRLFGIVHVTTTDAVATIRIGHHRLVFATPDDFRTMHPGVDLDPEFRLPGPAALEIAVGACARTAGYLAGAQVKFAELPDGSLCVPACAANGAILFFGEADAIGLPR
jgi:catechol 2,3-dioxygenase-like lactoylglutathione lyase family enzyme